MFETIKNLKEKHNLILEGLLEWEVEGSTVIFRYHSTNRNIGVVTSRPMKVDQYVVELLSFMECVSLLERNLFPWVV